MYSLGRICMSGSGSDLIFVTVSSHVESLSGGVTKNVTPHRMSKIEFQPVISTRQMHSFPKMYNTMGSKMDGLAVREHFLSKNAEKTAFLSDTNRDHLTLEGHNSLNFKD